MFIQHFEVKEYISRRIRKKKQMQIILDGGCGEFPKEYLTKFQEYLTKRVF
mgnify:CR=1 FL=1